MYVKKQQVAECHAVTQGVNPNFCLNPGFLDISAPLGRKYPPPWLEVRRWKNH
jgi:hypothetical protein